MADNNEQLQALLEMVAQKMGKTPQELQEQLNTGELQGSQQVRELLADKEQLQSFLKSPQVLRLLGELKKKN